MGLNLDVHHVAFADDSKFDGHQTRPLTPAEIGQIAGRAGRHMHNGTFGVTGQCDEFDEDLVQRLETHDFEPVRVLQWRNAELDFASIDGLLRQPRPGSRAFQPHSRPNCHRSTCARIPVTQ
jgi:ATP-dependent RNA helicase SUPV3L1/SUV3